MKVCFDSVYFLFEILILSTTFSYFNKILFIFTESAFIQIKLFKACFVKFVVYKQLIIKQGEITQYRQICTFSMSVVALIFKLKPSVSKFFLSKLYLCRQTLYKSETHFIEYCLKLRMCFTTRSFVNFRLCKNACLNIWTNESFTSCLRNVTQARVIGFVRSSR